MKISGTIIKCQCNQLGYTGITVPRSDLNRFNHFRLLKLYEDIFTIISEPSGSAHFAVPLQEEYHPMERDEDVRLYVKVAGEPYSPAKW